MLARAGFSCLAVIFGLWVPHGKADDRAGAEPRQGKYHDEAADGSVRLGMTAARVVELLGKPSRVSRQILFRRHVEQWTYPEPNLLRVEFIGVRGENPQVVSVHSLRSKKP